jgi:uncharacterized damage-inducible protein DinB
MIETVRLMFEYTRWADGRMFDALAKLSPEQWTKDLGSSLKSARDTAVHLVSAQWVWLSRWTGTSPKAMWDPAEHPSPAPLRARSESLAAELAAFAAEQSEATLAAELAYTNLAGKPQSRALGGLMLHVANHSTYHRGQVTTLLRQLGATPIATDLVLWFGERK